MRLLLLLPTHTYNVDGYLAAAERLGVDVTVGSEEDSTFSSADHDGLLTLDLCDPDRSADEAEAFASRHALDAVFGVDDATAVVAAHIGSRLGIPYSPITAVEAARDKYRQRQLLARARVSVPRFALVSLDGSSTVPHGLTYPVVAKPLTLSASRGVIRADNDDELRKALRTIGDILDEDDRSHVRNVLLEAYVAGAEFAVEGTVHDGRFAPFAVFEKPDPLEGPYFEESIYLTPPRIGEAEAHTIVECVADGVAALGLTHGPVHAEVRVNDSGAWLIEVAARPIGGKCARVLRFGSTGDVSLEELTLGLVLGTVESIPERERGASGVMMIPIPAAGVLRGVDGMEAAWSIPKVTDITMTVPLGARLRRLPYESRYLGFIFARADSTDAAERAIRSAHRELIFTIE